LKAREYDIVRLLRPLPEHRIASGETGTVVMAFPSPPGYLVEFADEGGVTEAIVALQDEDVERVSDRLAKACIEFGSVPGNASIVAMLSIHSRCCPRTVILAGHPTRLSEHE